MGETYTKLFGSITLSTVWQEPAAIRVVWITLLAESDQNGCVFASVPGLARLANVPRADAEAALGRFMAPDPDSRTPDHEGRRIEPIDGGWRLLNHAKFHAIRSEVDRKDYKREWDRTNRSRKKKPTASDNPTEIRQIPTQSDDPTVADLLDQTRLHKEQKSKADAPSAKRGRRLPPDWKPSAADIRFAEGLGVDWKAEAAAFVDFWISKAGAQAAKLDWAATWRNWCRHAKPRTNGNGRAASTVTKDFRGKVYKGTPIDEYPAHLRPDDE